jgi:hypothetical protein
VTSIAGHRIVKIYTKDFAISTSWRSIDMAVMIPDRPADFHGSPGERSAFQALRALDARCYVFHSLRWMRAAAPRTSPGAAQGEGDLVVFDPERGLLVIEVKSGGIRCEPGRWHQTNLATRVEQPMQDPEAQADRTRWHFDSLLNAKLGRVADCPVYHAVWFPSVDFPKEGLPPNMVAPMVLDRAALVAPASAIATAFAYGSGRPRPVILTSADVKRVLEVLAPCLHAAPSMRHALDVREQAFVRLTEEQSRVLDYLEDQRQATVSGAAGTGKTMVALALARRLTEQGQQVVFLCYNGPLCQFLRLHHGAARVQFETFDSLAARHVPDLAGDFVAAKSAFLDLLSRPDAPQFANVIVDEGQDFDGEWIEFLEANTVGTFYVFYDKNQLVQRDKLADWLAAADCRLNLRRNCRTTTQVARFAYKIAPTPLSLPADTVDGPKPTLHACETADAAAGRVAGILEALLTDGGYQPHEIAVLTMLSPDRSILGRIDRFGGHRLVDVPKRECITYASVRRFKGLEARAVVLVDISPSDLADSTVRRLAYVGASRAMQELHVVFHSCTRTVIASGARAILADGGKPNAHALASALGARWEKEQVDVQVME